MTQKYTPTTAEVRSQYEERGNLGWLPNVDPYNFYKQAMADAFDRWLHNVQAKAWSRGRDAAIQARLLPAYLIENPYESEEA